MDTANENRRLKKEEVKKFYSGISKEQALAVKKSLTKERSTRRKELSQFRLRKVYIYILD